MTFSERFGLRQPKVLVQSDSMDDDLRTALWNAAWVSLHESDNNSRQGHLYRIVFHGMWFALWKRPLDRMPSWNAFWDQLRQLVYNGDWNEVYDAIDYIGSFKEELSYP